MRLTSSNPEVVSLPILLSDPKSQNLLPYLTVIQHFMRLLTNLNGLFRSVLLLLAMLLALPAATAQGLSNVSGTVTDSAGEPLIGATVREKGTKNVTATDIDGAFNLKLTSANPVIEVSYIGYEPKKVNVTKSTLAIELPNRLSTKLSWLLTASKRRPRLRVLYPLSTARKSPKARRLTWRRRLRESCPA